MSKEKAIVVKKIADRFVVHHGEQEVVLSARGKLKEEGVFVGDRVEFDPKNLTIEKVEERTNNLIRPPMVNLEQLIIVIAYEPKPDFRVVDKLILFCFANHINPVLCVNKIDIAPKDFLDKIKFAYKNVCKTIFVSANQSKNLESLHKVLKGKISAFAGQSATGKSSLINAIYKDEKMKVGELSKKIKRGKNTTRHIELFRLEQNSYLADTPGFSCLDEKFLPIDYFELCYYYPDFLSFHENCKYKSCTHSKESLNECGVKRAVEEGKLDRGRHERYLVVFEILKEKWVRTHG